MNFIKKSLSLFLAAVLIVSSFELLEARAESETLKKEEYKGSIPMEEAVVDEDVIDMDGIKYRIIQKNKEGGTVKLGADLGWSKPSVPRDIEAFTIPENIVHEGKNYKVIKIGRNAFMDCNKLKKIVVPEGIDELEEGAFRRASAIESVVLPQSLVKIGPSAFSMCEKLAKINLTDNIKSIGKGSFFGCMALSNVKLPANLKEISEELFQGSGIAKIIIPASITKIGGEAFWSAESLGTVEFEKNSQCRGIGPKAFNFSAIRSINIPDTVNTIGEKAFSNCAKLKTIGIEKTGGGLVSVGNEAFLRTAISEFHIPGTLRYFDPDAIKGCGELEKVTVDENHPNYSSEDGVLFNKKKTILYLFPEKKSVEEYNIPETVENIGVYAFTEGKLKKVTFPKKLKTIDDFAFYKVEALEEVLIPAGVETIGRMAFSDCQSLRNVQLPDTLTAIASGAFYNLPALESLEVPAGVKSIKSSFAAKSEKLKDIKLKALRYKEIANGAFNGVSPDAIFTVENDEVKKMLKKSGVDESKIKTLGHEVPAETFKVNGILYKVIDDAADDSAGTVQVGNGVFSSGIPDGSSGIFTIPEEIDKDGKKYKVIKIGKNAFSYDGESFPWVKEVTVPDSVKVIEENAFNDCTDLRKFNLSKNSKLERIEKKAFDACGLTELNLPKNLKYIDESAFCHSKALENIVLPEGVLEIGNYAFSSIPKLKTMTLGKAVKKIGIGAFSENAKLTEINVSDENKFYNSKDGILYDYGFRSLVSYPTGKTDEVYNAPETLRSIEDYGFYKVSKLKKFVGNKHLETIGKNAFAYSDSMEEVDLSDSKAQLDMNSFMNCKKLKKVKLSKTLRVLPKNSFYSCAMEEIIIPEDVETIESGAFSKCDELKTVKIKSVELKKAANDIGAGERKFFVPNEEIKKVLIDAKVKVENITVDPSLSPDEEADTFQKGDLFFEVLKDSEGHNTKQVKLAKVNKTTEMENLQIPGEIKHRGFKYDVVKIGSSAIYSTENIMSIELPDTIEAIEDNAIVENKKLISLEIPSNVKYIGVNGIRDNLALASITFSGDSKLETLENGAFSGNSVLLNIKVPKSVKNMGTHVFFWNNNLKSVEFEKGSPIKEIPDGTFLNCFMLEQVIMENAPVRVGKDGFARTHNFKGIDLSKTEFIGEQAFWQCGKIESILLSKDLKEIGDAAFSECDNLASVEISEGLEKIGEMVSHNTEDPLKGAFSHCTKLTEVILPSTVKQLGTFTFRGCTQLGKVTLKSENFENIGSNVFDSVASDCHFIVQNDKVKNELINKAGIAATQIKVVNPTSNPGTPGVPTPPSTQNPSPQPDKKEPKDMEFLKSNSGETLTIKVPDGVVGCSISWKSLNEDIAEVNDKGELKTKKAGIVIIEALCKEQTYRYIISVRPGKPLAFKASKKNAGYRVLSCNMPAGADGADMYIKYKDKSGKTVIQKFADLKRKGKKKVFKKIKILKKKKYGYFVRAYKYMPVYKKDEKGKFQQGNKIKVYGGKSTTLYP